MRISGRLSRCATTEWALLLQAETQATLKRLSPDTLMAVLRSDNLRVPSEMHVFRSVVSWLEADKSRLPQVKSLIIDAGCSAGWSASVKSHPEECA